MQVGATRDVMHAGLLGSFCAQRGREVGVNWAFAPVVDLALNHRNPITGTRTFGSDADDVARLGAAYIRALQAGGVAGCAKHFPGDGVDDRDQHLVTSVNSLDLDRWRTTFGAVYRTAIDAGVYTIMAGHIALPALTESFEPATQSRKVLTDLLRGELGFDGLIVSDNTLMAGFSRPLPRRQAIPRAINAGCDMILGAHFVEEDYVTLLDAVRRGEITEERLREAVGRVLDLKARIGVLSRPTAPSGSPSTFESEKRGLAQASITLAKHTDDVLPVAAARYQRVLVYVIGDTGTFYDPAQGLAEMFIAGLRARGIETVRRDVPGEGRTQVTERELQDSVDLIIYFANLTFTSDSNSSRIRWSYPQAPESPRLPIPSLLVSIADPYHLQDLPSVGTAVNGYTPSPQTVEAVLAGITGELPMRGMSPIDPYCGYADARV
jgi:beta-N-acetylhexosaminidase